MKVRVELRVEGFPGPAGSVPAQEATIEAGGPDEALREADTWLANAKRA